MKTIEEINQHNVKKILSEKKIPDFFPGDVVKVGVRITEGKKERIQYFEGVDERVLSTRNIEEISIGDYVLSGGETAALVVLDSVLRLLPGVLGNEKSVSEETFENGLLEYPQYTKPQIWEKKSVPDAYYQGIMLKLKTGVYLNLRL